MEQGWREALQQGGMILTVNRRLARELSQAYALEMEEEGRGVWSPAAILPLNAWLESCWTLLLDEAEGVWPDASPPLLLREAQEAWVWESALASAPGGGELLRPAEAAKAAREAAELLTGYGITLAPHEVVEHEDGAAFLVWWQRFRQRCAEAGWLARADLSRHLLPRLSRLPLPSWVGLAGFDQLPPPIQGVIAALEQAGCRVERLPMPDRGAQAARLACRDREEECHLAARWARHLLETGQARSVGIVVPELSRMRSLVARHLEEVFLPGSALPGAAEHASPFEISAPLPLSQGPMVADALRLLGLLLGEGLEPPEYGVLLHSPFWGGPPSEWGVRAGLEARLRREGIWELNGARLAALARRWGGGLTLTGLLERLLGPEGRLAEARGRESPGVWAERFARWLRTLGWPGERPLSSAEHQSLEAWREVLSELAALGGVSGPMKAAEALERLRRMALERPFQPEGATDPPVRVMGTLEAAGLEFDALWLLGISDGVWPPMPAPNPFIPVALQRRFALPRATAEGELALAEILTRRLLASSPRVVVSHPRLEGDQPQRISPLLAHLPEISPEALGLPDPPRWAEGVFQSARLEQGWDGQAPPHPGGAVKGGTALLRAQSHCPFQGFARFRLHAQGLEDPQPGLTPLERGILVHEALARFWEEVVSQEALLGLDGGEVEAVTARAVASALARGERSWPQRLPPVLRELERQRLMRLLEAWLEQEKGRSPFAVEAREASASFTVAGLTLEVRLDRVDRLPDGGRVILDYKTGGTEFSARALLGKRLREPQLPIYALLEGEGPVRGVAFASVRRDTMGFHGVAQEPGILPKGVVSAGMGNLPDWEALMNHWQGALEGLGEGWRKGEAAVLPLKQACSICDLTPLCRIAELGPEDGEEDDDGA